ncbi:uncharacterized protein [Ptychodera flava]|uniref:uncharacterized protein n=1 Tax=Ptychodera flava TaxID=63121 RepID=UPI003969D718
MKSAVATIFIVLAWTQVIYTQNCSFPDDIAGSWLYSIDNSDNDGKLDLNSENYTETSGEDRKTYVCFKSAPENATYILKTVNDDQSTSYKCFAYKKVNGNVFIGYTASIDSTEEAPSCVKSDCGDLRKFPTPGKAYYNAAELEAVQCAVTGKYEWTVDGCINKTSTLEVCSGQYKSMQYAEGCGPVQAPFVNKSMNCLASWENTDGLNYSLVQTGEIKDDNNSWKGKFVCMAHKLVNNTLRLTARDFECDADQTDTQIGDGLTAEMEKVSRDEDCIPPSTTAGVGSLAFGLPIAIFVVASTALGRL